MTQQYDYNVCPENADGVHAPVKSNVDFDIAETHVSVQCGACGTTTGYAIENFVDELEWN